MKYEHLHFFRTPKEDLKITPVYRNVQLLGELNGRSGGAVSLPDAAAYYATPVVFPKPGPDRPYIVSSIVLSADGKMAFLDNKAGPLIAGNNYLDPHGAAVDFWCLNMLRAYSDGLLIGANTLKNEPDCICNCMELDLARQRRELLGKPDQPCQILVSLDGTDIPFEHIIFQVHPEERLKVIIATSPAGWEYIRKNSPLRHEAAGPFHAGEQADAAGLPALDREFDLVPVIVTGEENRPDMKLMLSILRRLGMETLCAESPTYCAALMDNGCLDEYFINYSMVFAGGSMSPGAGFPKSCEDHPHADLVSVGIHRQNFIYTRQLLRYGVKSE